MTDQADRRAVVFAGAAGVASFFAMMAGKASAETSGESLQQPAAADHTATAWVGPGGSLTPGELDTTNMPIALRLHRMEAALAVQNTMSRYAFLHTSALHEETLGLFAMKTPDVRVEMMWGVYEGPESLRRLYPGYHVYADGDGKGRMHIHTLTSPIIEVAGDGKTARGAWISPGVETGVFDPSNKITANWGWMKYGADFIQEDGQWKIWHLHVFGLFLANYYKSWADVTNDMKPDEMPMPAQFKPDRPPTTHWEYSTDRKAPLAPVPPSPYATFNQSASY